MIEFDFAPQLEEINKYFEEIDGAMFTIQAEDNRLNAKDLADVAGDTQIPDTDIGEGAGGPVVSSAGTSDYHNQREKALLRQTLMTALMMLL